MLRLVFFWILENRGFGPDEVSITQFELCFVLETVCSRGERSKKTATLTTTSTHLAQFQLVAVATEAREIVQTGRPRRRSTKEVAAILASWEACQEVFREAKPWALSIAIGFVLGRCSIKHKMETDTWCLTARSSANLTAEPQNCVPVGAMWSRLTAET